MNAAKQRQQALGHVLLIGPTGVGKAALAKTIGNEIDVRVMSINGMTGCSPNDLLGLLTTLETAEIFFVEDIHGLEKRTAEFLQRPMRDFAIDIIIDAGPSARSVRLNLPMFTLIGTAPNMRRIIDDCDYYIVIVAGRYGSRARSGKSYTEMEFDYAVSRGKSVIGFFHEDLDSLPGTKLERSEEAQRKLALFSRKVRTRICKPWRTADGLASAVKSAMLNAIEHDPKPGWMRAPQTLVTEFAKSPRS